MGCACMWNGDGTHTTHLGAQLLPPYFFELVKHPRTTRVLPQSLKKRKRLGGLLRVEIIIQVLLSFAWVAGCVIVIKGGCHRVRTG